MVYTPWPQVCNARSACRGGRGPGGGSPLAGVRGQRPRKKVFGFGVPSQAKNPLGIRLIFARRMGMPVGIAPSLLTYFHSWDPRDPAGSFGTFRGARENEKAPRAVEKVFAFPGKPPRTVSDRFGGGGDKTRNRVVRPRGGWKSRKHAKSIDFNSTPGPPSCRGSEQTAPVERDCIP